MTKNAERGLELLKELTSLLSKLTDEEIGILFNSNSINSLLYSILNIKEFKNYSTIANFLLAKKKRSQIIALLKYFIDTNFTFKVTKYRKILGYVSPNFIQWFDDGVMFFEGSKPFSGAIGYYNGEELKYPISYRLGT